MYMNEKGESSFGRRLNEVFAKTGKLISVDILRHSFITNFFSKASFKTLNDNTLEEVASSLGHSSAMFLSYRKIDSSVERVESFLKEEEKK